MLDRYRVLGRLAAGGHSVVYRGDDERLSRPVCIKVFHRAPSDAGVSRAAYEHFIQEAFALSRLTHPNTLRIYDFGHLDGQGGDSGAPFQVSEFMSGGTLSQMIRHDGPLGPTEAARIVASLCGALTEAHECGIVHRDLKPQNILFGSAGMAPIPKLADFGIAKTLPLPSAPLRNSAGDTGVSAGSPLLMYSPKWAAPEQLIGARVSPATDVYSLALLTIYMLTARRVFESTELEQAYEAREHAAELIAAALADCDLPRSITEACIAACAFDPRERTQTVQAFARLLDLALLDVDPITVPRDPPNVPGLTALEPAPDRRRPTPPPPRRLRLAAQPVPVAQRAVRFALLPHDGAVIEVGGARLRATLLPGTGPSPSVHVKGVSCFVALAGKPPSPAVNLDADAVIELVAPNRAPIGRAQLLFGRAAAGHTLLSIGDETIAIGSDECAFVFALDFGPGSDCVFLYRSSR